ncbi:MAG: ATP-binding protein [Acidimicrobiales bacterium]
MSSAGVWSLAMGPPVAVPAGRLGAALPGRPPGLTCAPPQHQVTLRGRYGSAIESRLSLPADPSSASVARRFVRGVLDRWGAEEFEEPATLLISELVTNAVLHAHSAPEVVVRLEAGRLWVGVSDGLDASPVRKHYGPEAATGRGMMLVERIASTWGTDVTDSGKVVWFELAPGSSGVAATTGASIFDLDDLLDGTEPPGGVAHRRRVPTGPRPSSRRPAAPASRARRTRTS